MIKSLKLANFQIHKRLEIDFDPKITTIVGSSDVGKSACIRALRWAALNSPTGEAFIRQGAKGCTVIVDTDKHVIKRKRGKGVNCFVLDGKPLEAMGKGVVPDEVMDALRLDDLNFQGQHDSPLWLSASSGDVAKSLNEIVNLDLIDRVLGKLSRQAKFTSTELTVCQNRILNAQSEVKSLEWIELADLDYQQIEIIMEKIDKTNQQLTQLEALTSSIEKTQATIDKLTDVLGPMEEQIAEIEKIEDKLKQTEKQLDTLDSLLENIENTQSSVYEIETQLKAEQAKLDAVKTCPVCNSKL